MKESKKFTLFYLLLFFVCCIMSLRKTITGFCFRKGGIILTEEDLLHNFPFNSKEELADWIISYLPKKVVKYAELETFLTIVNGEETPELYKRELETEEGTILDITAKLSYIKLKFKLFSEENKKASYIIGSVNIL